MNTDICLLLEQSKFQNLQSHTPKSSMCSSYDDVFANSELKLIIARSLKRSCANSMVFIELTQLKYITQYT